MNLNGGMVLQLHSFLNSALDIDEWSALRPTLYANRNSLRYP